MTNLVRVSKHNNATNWVYRRYRALTRTDLHGEKALLPGQDARVADPLGNDPNPIFEKKPAKENRIRIFSHKFHLYSLEPSIFLLLDYL